MHEPDTTVGDNGAPRSPITPIHDHDDLPPLPAHHAEPLSPIAAGRPSQDEAAKKAVQDVLYSDVCHLQKHEAGNESQERYKADAS